MQKNKQISHEFLLYWLDYDAQSGIFRKKTSPGLNRVVGSTDKEGYVYISIKGIVYPAHRLAWFYVTGCWPKNKIDHKDCVKTNNSFSNLRDVDSKMNSQNQQRPHIDNKSGYLGVHQIPNGKFRARIQVNKKSTCLGCFNTAEEAYEAYIQGKRKIHPGALI